MPNFGGLAPLLQLSAPCSDTSSPIQSDTQSEIPYDFRICSPFHTSSSPIFLAEADRLEAGGFNLVIEIKLM